MANNKEPTAPAAIAWQIFTLSISTGLLLPICIQATKPPISSEKRYIGSGFLPNVVKKLVHLPWFHFNISTMYISAEINTRSIPTVNNTNELVHNFLLMGKAIFQHRAKKMKRKPYNISLDIVS